QGLPGAMATVWWGLIGPKDLPPDVTAKLNAALQSALNDPDVKKRFAEMGAVVTPGTDKQFGQFVAAETIKWTKVIKDAGIKAD
ncbi:MAG: tripartite tricarboxylate transporter substrate-binding protein, partial [Achromobacter mucicolens]